MIKLKGYLLLLSVVLGFSACQFEGNEEEQVGRLSIHDSLRSALSDSVGDNLPNSEDNLHQDNPSRDNPSGDNGRDDLGRENATISPRKTAKSSLTDSTDQSLAIKKPRQVPAEQDEGNLPQKGSAVPPKAEERSELLLNKGLTLDKLREMGFLYVKLNIENLKSVQGLYDSGYMDTLAYEKTKLSIEKNLRIIRLLNQLSVEKGLQDNKFAVIYLDQFVGIVREGLITSQEVLQYLQKIYDTQKVSQHRYIVSANNLRVNVNLMWTIIKEIDF